MTICSCRRRPAREGMGFSCLSPPCHHAARNNKLRPLGRVRVRVHGSSDSDSDSDSYKLGTHCLALARAQRSRSMLWILSTRGRRRRPLVKRSVGCVAAVSTRPFDARALVLLGPSTRGLKVLYPYPTMLMPMLLRAGEGKIPTYS